MENNYIQFLICDVFLTGIIVFLIQQLFLYKLNKRLKTFESKLDAVKSKDVVRYEKLYSEAVPRINKLTSMINEERVICNEAIIRGYHYANYNDPQSKEKYDAVAKRLIEKHSDIRMYLMEHSSYLPDDLVASFEKMCDTLGSALNIIIDKDPDTIKRNHELFNEKLFNASEDLGNRLKSILSIDLNDPWENNN